MDEHTLSNKYEKKLEFFNKILEKLSDNAERGTPILVEGKNDFAALRKLGIKGKVICLKNCGKVFVDRLDAVQSSKVILLVDFDDYGIALSKRIIKYFEEKGIKVNSIFWKKIGAIVKKDVKDIEGLPSYLERLKKYVEELSLSNEY